MSIPIQQNAVRQICRSSTRQLRSQTTHGRFYRGRYRFQSSSSGPSAETAKAGGSGAVAGGVAGGLVAVVVGYGIYHFSGARSTVNSVDSVKQQFEAAIKKTTESAPEPDKAIQWLRQSLSGYAALIPGAKPYVDSTLNELENVKKEHGPEVDKIVRKTYSDLQAISKEEGVSMTALTRAWDVLQKTAQQIKDLAGDVGKDLLEKNPEIKEKLGGKVDDLKRMGDQFGPEAKKKVDETWSKVQDILKGGFGAGSADEIRKLIEDTIKDVRKMGDQAYEKGLEKVKPYLDKNPQVKEFVEKNKDKLKELNLDELWKKVQQAAESGDTKELEKFAKDSADKAKQNFHGQGLEQYLKMIPGGEDVGGKFKQLQELSEKHGKDAEKLMKEAFEDVRKVLEKKVDEGQKLADDVKKDVK